MTTIYMTKAEALSIQAEQVEHYAGIYGGWIRNAVAAKTTAEQLTDGWHDVADINQHIPRGCSIEFIIHATSRRRLRAAEDAPLVGADRDLTKWEG